MIIRARILRHNKQQKRQMIVLKKHDQKLI